MVVSSLVSPMSKDSVASAWKFKLRGANLDIVTALSTTRTVFVG